MDSKPIFLRRERDTMITPYVKIDLKKVRSNIEFMVDNLKKNGIEHRPHVKPHKSIELAKLQIESGAAGIACASLSELEVMAKGGLPNILLAIPLIGYDQWEKLYNILDTYDFQFTTISDSEFGLTGLSEIGRRLQRPIDILVDVDSGGHREGIQSDQVLDFARKVESNPWLTFKGLFTYYGHIYQYENSRHAELAKEEAVILLEQKEKLEENGIQVKVLSGGSTVSSMNAESLKGITESRAGNYIFFDMNAVHLGIVGPEQCALKVVAKVISKPIPGKATIDAGSKAITSDQPLKEDAYGYISNNPDLKILKLNEEHGFIEYDPKKVQVEIGDEVEIIPNHACVVPNLYNQVFLKEDDNKGLRSMAVDARGRNY